MNLRALALTAMVTLGVAGSTVADAKSNRWEVLGRRSVSLTHDHDTIQVGFTEGTFRRLRLAVRGNGLFVNSMTVVYRTGGHDMIPLRYHIPQGGESRDINLRGGNRVSRRVDLSYRSVHNGRGHAEVILSGRH